MRRFRFYAAPGLLFGDEGVSGFRFPRPDRHIDRESVSHSLPPRLSLDKLACRAFEADSPLVQDAPLGAVLPGEGGEPDAREVRLGPAIIDHRPDPAKIRIDPVRERHVGGILLHFAHVWAEDDCLPWVVKVLAEGYRLKFRLVPPLTRQPPLFGRLQSPKREARLDLVRAMLEKEVIEPVQDVSSPGFYSLLFLVPKVTGGWRPVIDLSTLNRYLDIPTFSMETAERIRACLQLGAWVTSLDLKDAYFHIPVHPSYRKFLRFPIEGELFQFRALPFGISTAPWLFTKVVLEVKKIVHRWGIQLFQYLDDWLIQASSANDCLRHTEIVLRLCQDLGLVVNKEKSALVPTQRFLFLGYQFDLVSYVCTPPRLRFDKIVTLITHILLDQGTTALKWQVLLGLLASSEKAVPLGRLHTREIHYALRCQWDFNPSTNHCFVGLLPPARDNLLWWTLESNIFRGSPIVPLEPEVRILTDASEQGWGAHMDWQTASGMWSAEEARRHINFLELQAVQLAIRRWLRELQGRVVQVELDNSTAVAYLNHQGGARSISLTRLATSILLLCHHYQIVLVTRHIPGARNVLADSLSRKGQVLPGEWSLNPAVFLAVTRLWGTPMVDLFATKRNALLPFFVSPFPDPAAMAVDALSLSWRHMWGYAYPPHALLPSVLRKIRHDMCRIILIAPLWPEARWFVSLLELLMDLPRRLPMSQNLLSQGSLVHRDPSNLRLHAFHLSGNPSEIGDFQNGLRTVRLDRNVCRHSQSMNLSGDDSFVGVVSGKLIHAQPLQL